MPGDGVVAGGRGDPAVLRLAEPQGLGRGRIDPPGARARALSFDTYFAGCDAGELTLDVQSIWQRKILAPVFAAISKCAAVFLEHVGAHHQADGGCDAVGHLGVAGAVVALDWRVKPLVLAITTCTRLRRRATRVCRETKSWWRTCWTSAERLAYSGHRREQRLWRHYQACCVISNVFMFKMKCLNIFWYSSTGLINLCAIRKNRFFIRFTVKMMSLCK